VTLTGVEAMSVEGGIELLGGYVFVASEGFLTAVDGFPPTGLDEDAYEPIAGAKVLTDCAEEDPEVKTQLIVGAGRSESEGGRIEGIRILYEGGSLEIPDYSIVLCGDEMEHCEDLGLDG
jgi:hypothetical protein